MDTLLVYMVKVALYLTAFYIVYSLLLSRDTTYGRNRAYILLSLTFAIIFPFISIQTGKPLDIQQFGKLLQEVFITAENNESSKTGGLSFAEVLQIIYPVYIIGVVVLLLKLLIDFLNLGLLILRHRNEGSRIIRFHGFNTSGFSAMGYIFISTRLSSEESAEIIRHEQNHLHKNHFIDIIFIEIVKAFQWFNPVVYLFNLALRAIHEFQADQECLSSGVPVVNYQSLLLKQVFRSGGFNLTNSFSNPSLIKRRMIMMTKKRTSAFASMKLLLVLPVTLVVFLAISAYKEAPELQPEQSKIANTGDLSPVITTPIQLTVTTAMQNKSSELSDNLKVTNNNASNVKTDDIAPPPPPPPPPPSDNQNVKKEEAGEEVPFVVVEEMPMFPGGDVALLKYIGENTNYPEAAKTNDIQGRVIIRFCVTAKGGVSQASVLKSVSPELDAEAIRVVETLPAFIPGKQGGKDVPVWYMVPISFTLK